MKQEKQGVQVEAPHSLVCCLVWRLSGVVVITMNLATLYV